jgi:hypothetical protein
VWALLAEWCADAFAATNRDRTRLAVVIGLAASAPLWARWGWRGVVPVTLLAVVAFVVARDVVKARASVESAAHLPLADPRQEPEEAGGREDPLAAHTTVALRRLAAAINAARRGRYMEAHDLVPRIDRARLRAREIQLLDAVRAMVSIGLGDDHRAAQQAIEVLPTGSDELDACLGRAIIADAWTSPDRLRVIDSAWTQAGVELDGQGALTRLRRLVRVRTGQRELDQLATAEARALCDDARAIGDEELAVELDLQARQSRTYR